MAVSAKTVLDFSTGHPLIEELSRGVFQVSGNEALILIARLNGNTRWRGL